MFKNNKSTIRWISLSATVLLQMLSFCLNSLSPSALVTDKTSSPPCISCPSSAVAHWKRSVQIPTIQKWFHSFFYKYTISFLNNLYTQTNRNKSPVTSIYKAIDIKEAEIVKLQKDLVNQKHSGLSVPDFDVIYMAIFLPFFKALVFFLMCKKHIFRGYDHVKIFCNSKTDIALDMFVLQ